MVLTGREAQRCRCIDTEVRRAGSAGRDVDPAATPGRTVERALRLLAGMIVSHYPQERT